MQIDLDLQFMESLWFKMEVRLILTFFRNFRIIGRKRPNDSQTDQKNCQIRRSRKKFSE